METTATEAQATRVVYGVNDLELDLAGRRIAAVYPVLEQVLNIPREAKVTVNGGPVDDDYVVRPGDEIEFLKNAGVKGQQAGATSVGMRRESGSIRPPASGPDEERRSSPCRSCAPTFGSKASSSAM